MRAKMIVAGVVVVAVLLAAAAWLVKRWFENALYEPGSVRAGRDAISPLDPPPGGPDADGFIDVGGGVRLYTFEQGAGRNVLLLHGGPGHPFARAWSGLEPLASRYAFLYYHQRGCGRSTRPFDGPLGGNTWERIQRLHRTLGLPAQIADIERMRRALGEEQLVLIGHSFGGLLAALYVAEFPEHVQALVLVCAAPLVVMPAGDGDLFEEIRGLLPASERERYAGYGQARLRLQGPARERRGASRGAEPRAGPVLRPRGPGARLQSACGCHG